MHRFFSILVLVVTFHSHVKGQISLTAFDGIPPMIKYSAKDFGGNSQIWDVIQSDQGMIYAASFGGILEFDGEEWTVLAEPLIQSFQKNVNGRIYAGGYGSMGYLETTRSGMNYFSLLDLLPEGVEVLLIRNVHIIDQRVYFVAHEHIYIYNEKSETLSVIDSDNRMYPSHVFEDQLVIMVDKKGLFEVVSDSLKQIQGGEYWADKVVANFVDGDHKELITLSSESGAHILSDDGPKAASFFDPDYFKQNVLFGAKKIGEANYGLCFLTGGFVLTDKQFNPLLVIDKQSGMNNQAHNVYADDENNLWVSTNDGLVYLNVSSRLTNIGKALGIEGSISSTATFNGDWYTIGNAGIYYRSFQEDMSLLSPKQRTFKQVDNSEIGGITLIKTDENLFSTHTRKKGEIRTHKLDVLLENQNTYHAAGTYAEDGQLIITNGENGNQLEVFKLVNGSWKHHYSISDSRLPSNLINTVVYDSNCNCFWAVSTFNEAYRFSLNASHTDISEVIMLEEEDGLPQGLKQVFLLEERVYFGTPKGLYYYSFEQKKFIKDKRFADYFDEIGIYSLVKEGNQDYWYLSTNQQMGHINLDAKDGSIIAEKDLFATVNTGASTAYLAMVSDDRLAIGTLDGMYIVQTKKEESYDFTHQPIIRSVTIIQTDSTIFHGGDIGEQNIVLSNQFNSLNFKFAVPYFKGVSGMHYRTKLIGFDKDWSPWTEKTQRDYTNLPQGDYAFSVQARNVYGKLSAEVFYEFKVNPPWYLSSWAYLIYLLLLLGLIRLIIFFNSRRLIAENLKLENTIKERVQEIEDQKGIIARSLEEKESLLKEIHHRVKNNLQIIASLLYLQSGKFENEDYKRVLEEGQGRVRSMALIHQKLYENDDLKSIPFEEYLRELINEIKTSFGMHDIELMIDAKNILFDVDTAVPLGLIINELATNSFKYAFEGRTNGTFSVSLTNENGHYSLNLADNGKGLPSEIDIMKTKSLGLRLVRMLSQQLEGKFDFDSKDGTCFNLNFVA